jgi:hypothetical protein
VGELPGRLGWLHFPAFRNWQTGDRGGAGMLQAAAVKVNFAGQCAWTNRHLCAKTGLVSDSGLSGVRGVPAAAGQREAVLEGQWQAASQARRDDVLVVPGRGLHLPPQLPFARWLRVGTHLAEVYTSSAWCMGDWLVYGEAAYAGRYREAIERTCLDYQTLRNYAWVAKRFSLSRRRDGLSFGHHAEVAALPEAEQDFWLRKAQDLGWSVKQLRHQVRASLSERSPADGGRPHHALGHSQDKRPTRASRSRVRLNIRVTPEQMESCEAAASKAGITIEEWAALTLDQAARRLLDTDLLSAVTSRPNSAIAMQR